jgi:uncharacterized membrane protein YkvA (DUF1232 family)
MALGVSMIRTVLISVPRHARLAYCLLRDDRVPAGPKIALLAALGIIVSPIDFPAWIPVVGELDVLALSVIAVKTFVDACPDELVREHEASLRRKDSIFHQDLRRLTGAARQGATGAYQRWQTRRAG